MLQICQRQDRDGVLVCAQAFIDALPRRLCPDCRQAPDLTRERERFGMGDWPRDANGSPVSEYGGEPA